MADYVISTQTYVVYSDGITAVDLSEAHKKLNDPEFNIQGGKILNVKHETPRPTTQTSFLKCLTLAIVIGDNPIPVVDTQPAKPKRGRKTCKIKHNGKMLSVKIFKNGSTQITGCKSLDHVKFGMNIVYRLFGYESVTALNLASIMINVNFDMGFKLNRERLGTYMYEEKCINVPPLTSGYMGIKIRIPSLVDKKDLMIQRLSWSVDEGFKELDPVPYMEFFAHDQKKTTKQFTACVGIFQNGKILMTCMDSMSTDAMCKYVKNILNEARSAIEVVKKPQKTFRR